MKINREKILNRIDAVPFSAGLFARLCSNDYTGLVQAWLGHMDDKLPVRLEKRVNVVFLLIEQVILEMGKPPEEIHPGDLFEEVKKRLPWHLRRRRNGMVHISQGRKELDPFIKKLRSKAHRREGRKE